VRGRHFGKLLLGRDFGLRQRGVHVVAVGSFNGDTLLANATCKKINGMWQTVEIYMLENLNNTHSWWQEFSN